MNLDFTFYRKLLLRRLPVMLVFLLLCSGIGVITAMELPKSWSTSARLLVEAPQIPDEMVASMVQTDATEQLDIIQQRLLTRANLIEIAHKFNVFEDFRDMETDTVVEEMEAATRIRRSSGRGEATMMTIEFSARTGQIAAGVVNEFVTLVLAENTRFRTARAESTLNFFQQEVQRLNTELEAQSAAIASFKAENVDALPEDQSYRMSRQSLLQERLERLERDRTAAQAQRDEIVRIFEATGTIRPGGQGQIARTPEEERFMRARAELDQALTVYSESHPTVVRLKARVDQLAASMETLPSGTADAQGEGASDENVAENAILQATLAEVDTRLELMDRDIESTQNEIAALQDAISRSSANGIALASLERDYENIQARYNSALSNLNSARMSERVETTAQGQRINVIENASVPSVPSGPNRPKIAAMGAGAGIALAVGYFMLLEILNRTVRRPAELIGRFDVTPISVIPYMESRGHKLVRRTGMVAATLFVLIAVPFTLWYVDTHYIPLELVVQKGLDRLGLG